MEATFGITATFTDYTYIIVPSKRKGGRDKCICSEINIIDTLHPVTVKFDIIKTLYIRGKDFNDPECRYKTLYNIDGTYAYGIWQHGRYGSTPHKEGIQVNSNNILCTVTSYCSGQKIDQKKYLKSINI